MRRRIRSAAFPVHRHAVPQLVVDGVMVALAYFLAFWLRFEGYPRWPYGPLFAETIAWAVLINLVALGAFGQYQRLWRFVGQRDYEAVLKSVVVGTVVLVGAIALIHPVEGSTTQHLVIPHVVHGRLHDAHRTITGPLTAATLPGSVISLFFLLALLFLIGARFAVQLITDGRVRGPRVGKGFREVLVIGGGDGGRLVVRELMRNPQLDLRPVGFLDDDPRKLRIKDEHGLKVLGDTSGDLERVLDEVEPDEVVIAIPSAPGTLRARVVTACRARGIPVRTMPTVFELLRDGSGQMRVTRQLREVRVEDMLGREPVREELERVGAYLHDQVVLVTGAGGSIGSELCRQIARVGPRWLVLVDHAEDNLFEIARELEEDRHVRTAIPVLADCKEEERLREVMAEYRPTIVFHAAAYKHVVMIEQNPVEAVRNNALADAARGPGRGRERGRELRARVERQGGDAGDRDGRLQGAGRMGGRGGGGQVSADTRYATVRFGNVLASSGSVVPIFRRQIAAGGPVTVTDPRMKRYFMTIPEAVQLIIRAGSLGERSGEIYVLEMGEPISILELAEQMIRLSGLEPERDIAIEIVGARPGEKFHEELFNPSEHPQPTPAQRIMRASHDPLDPAWVERTFAEINLLVLEGDAAALAKHVSDLSDARVTQTESGDRTAAS